MGMDEQRDGAAAGSVPSAAAGGASGDRTPPGRIRVVPAEDALTFAQAQIANLVNQAPGVTASYTSNGRWVLGHDAWAPSWSGGFLAGMMWIFAERSGESWWLEQQAETYSRLVSSRKDDEGTHDIGFLLEPSFGQWYDWLKNDEARQVLIDGGRTMAGRFQPAGGYLSSWVDPGSTFIDIMMNVGIIFRAAAYTDDERLREVALAHCYTSRRHLMRGDGSTIHEGWFDVDTGEFLRAATHQGWRADSMWARGQAWAIYGFGDAYRHTGEADFLDAAGRAADFYIGMTPHHGIPPNDWADPRPSPPWESSAAAIAAAAMLRLAEACGPGPQADRYRSYGLQTLTTLRSTEFLAIDTPGWEGILRHATYHTRNSLGFDESVMWGEYYLVEGLHLAARLDANSPPSAPGRPTVVDETGQSYRG